MAKSSDSTGNGKQGSKPHASAQRQTAVAPSARSLKIAEKGITTGSEFTACMSALMGDLLAERVPVKLGNAVCSAGRNMLAAVALQMRLEGATANPQKRKQLVLVPGTGE
jgi:hypothetical protein